MNPFGFAQRRVPRLKEMLLRSKEYRRLRDVLGAGIIDRLAVGGISVGAFDHGVERGAFLDARVGPL